MGGGSIGWIDDWVRCKSVCAAPVRHPAPLVPTVILPHCSQELPLWARHGAGSSLSPVPVLRRLFPGFSLTLPCVASTWEILFLVTGHGKQGILSRIFANEDLPANRARPLAGETIWFIDDAAKPVNFSKSQNGIRVPVGHLEKSSL